MGNYCCETAQGDNELGKNYQYYKLCVLELPIDSSSANKERYSRETVGDEKTSNIKIQIWKKNKDFGHRAEGEAVNNIFYQGCDAVLIKITSELSRG